MSASDAMPVNDRDGWRRVWGTDFAGDDVALGDFPEQAAAWDAYLTGPDSSGHGWYSPHDVVSIENGILTERIHTADGRHKVAAILPKYPQTTYNRYAMRIRMDSMPGYKFVGLLWPNSNPDPNLEGEIDWVEKNTDSDAAGGYLHPKGGGPEQWCKVTSDDTVWHVYEIEHSPNLLVYFRDGVETFRTDIKVPNTRMHWVLQTETAMGTAPPPADDVAGVVQVDWVVVWHYDLTAKAPLAPRQLTVTAPASATGTAVPVTITASPDVTQVKLVVDAIEVGYSRSAPYTAHFDSTRFSNGVHTIHAKGRGAWWFDGPTRTIKVANRWDLVCPDTVAGMVQLSVTPMYLWFAAVKYVVDGHEILGGHWDTTKSTNGVHEVYCKTLGQTWVDGAKHTITVNN
jgi:hypothetical protein